MIDQRLLAGKIISNNMDALQQEALNKQEIDLLKADNTQNKIDIAARQLISTSSEKIVYTGQLPAVGENLVIDLTAYDLSLYNVYYGMYHDNLGGSRLWYEKNSSGELTLFASYPTTTTLYTRSVLLSNVAIVENVISMTFVRNISSATVISTGVTTYTSLLTGGGYFSVKLVRKAVTIWK